LADETKTMVSVAVDLVPVYVETNLML